MKPATLQYLYGAIGAGGADGGRLARGGGVHGSYGGFEYAAWEARRELLEEAEGWRLARLARGPRRSLRERAAPVVRLVVGFLRMLRPRLAEDEEGAVGGAPDFAYLTGEPFEDPDTAVEVYLGAGGCVVRKTDLRTGATTDAFVADGRVRP